MPEGADGEMGVSHLHHKTISNIQVIKKNLLLLKGRVEWAWVEAWASTT